MRRQESAPAFCQSKHRFFSSELKPDIISRLMRACGTGCGCRFQRSVNKRAVAIIPNLVSVAVVNVSEPYALLFNNFCKPPYGG
jgi:hypothetical protein